MEILYSNPLIIRFCSLINNYYFFKLALFEMLTNLEHVCLNSWNQSLLLLGKPASLVGNLAKNARHFSESFFFLNKILK